MDYKDFMAGYTKNFFWFKAKNDLIKTLMSSAWNQDKKADILIIGAGTGDELGVLNRFGRCYVVDKNKDALNRIDRRLCRQKKLADACDLPYGDGFFDVAVSLDVFEHIENDARAVAEIYRVLKKDGVLIFTVPAFSAIMSSHDKALHHLRRYNKKRLHRLFSKFSQRSFFYWNSILFPPIAVIRILRKRSRVTIDRMYLFSWVNEFFYRLLIIDNILIKIGRSFPAGLTIAGYCRK